MLETMYVYVPAARPDIVVLVPDPVVITFPGERVNIHVPVAGSPFSTTLPVATEHVGWVMVPTAGAVGGDSTVSVKVAWAGKHMPTILSVVSVITTVFPKSPAAGVYVNENGDAVTKVGISVPVPSSVNVTLVALPPNVFPFIVIGVVPQVVPVVLVSESVGHCPLASIEINKIKLTKRRTLDMSFVNKFIG